MNNNTIEKRPQLKLDLNKPVGGYWDGGRKQYGTFLPPKDFTPKTFMRWGCWELNFWFSAKSGVSWKTAARAAQKRLCSLVKLPNATVSIVWEEVEKEVKV